MKRLLVGGSAEKIHGVVRYAMDDVRRIICPFDAGLTLGGREAQVGDGTQSDPESGGKSDQYPLHDDPPMPWTKGEWS